MTPKACALVLVTCLLLASGPTGSTGPTGSEAAEATQGASGVSGASGSGGTGTCSYDAHHEKLWCSLRTLNAQNNTASIQSSTRARHMNVQCSDVFFYESILRTNHFNYLPNLQSLTLEFCKIRRIPSLAFSGLSGLHELVIRTHNSEWSAMVMELESDAFTGKASNIYLFLESIWNIVSQRSSWQKTGNTGYSFWDQLRNFLHKFTRIVLSVHKLNKLGKFW